MEMSDEVKLRFLLSRFHMRVGLKAISELEGQVAARMRKLETSSDM